MAAQNAGAAHAQQIAPLPVQRVQHQRTEPDVRGLRNPHALVVGHGTSNDLIRGKWMSGLHASSILCRRVSAIDRNNRAGDKRSRLGTENNTGPATSSGRPSGPWGSREQAAPSGLDRPASDWVSGVAIQPGATAFTRMPSAAQASARERVSCAIPPLLALYAGTRAPPKKLSMDAIFTMQPRVSA